MNFAKIAFFRFVLQFKMIYCCIAGTETTSKLNQIPDPNRALSECPNVTKLIIFLDVILWK